MTVFDHISKHLKVRQNTLLYVAFATLVLVFQNMVKCSLSYLTYFFFNDWALFHQKRIAWFTSLQDFSINSGWTVFTLPDFPSASPNTHGIYLVNHRPGIKQSQGWVLPDKKIHKQFSNSWIIHQVKTKKIRTREGGLDTRC